MSGFQPTISHDMKNIVGPRIREARFHFDRKITQDELAARLQSQGIDLDRTAISKIENGKRPVTDVEIMGICLALDIKVGMLFREE